MRPISLVAFIVAAAISYLGLAAAADAPRGARERAAPARQLPASPADADRLRRTLPGVFVPNLGQWNHHARFVHCSGPMTVFLEERGWVLDLRSRTAVAADGPRGLRRGRSDPPDGEPRAGGVALRMAFQGDPGVSHVGGENRLPGHHNYLLGADASRWRTQVPLYASVRYENLYPGIDLRLREANGVPEYDLLLQPGADLSQVIVEVEGGLGLSIAADGALVIDTALGPLIQSVPKTWQVGSDGARRDVRCAFRVLDGTRFGFEVTGWDRGASLTIDPGLCWSTYLGGSGQDYLEDVHVDARGVVTVAGYTYSSTSSNNFPTTLGAYDRTFRGGDLDAFVCRLDPSKSGNAQLGYSTFLGGSRSDVAVALSVDASGVVTIAGETGPGSTNDFPTTPGAYDRSMNGPPSDGFVARLDPSRTGSAQLLYGTFLGGSGEDPASDVAVEVGGAVLVTGRTSSTNFPTTPGAYDTTHGGNNDAYLSRLDPGKTGQAQLTYSTFLGGSDSDVPFGLAVDTAGVATVAGSTLSTNFPTTSGAYDATLGGRIDAFVSRLDLRRTAGAQLTYSTFLGGDGVERAHSVSVDAGGVITVAGETGSSNFPVTSGAFGPATSGQVDGFVSRLDPGRSGGRQLVYSTYLGGGGLDRIRASFVDAQGVITVAGYTDSANFPTTAGAIDTVMNLGDAFVSRLDPRGAGPQQLLYSTFLGGSRLENPNAVAVDASGVVFVGGETGSTDFPTTTGAFATASQGSKDVFVSRIDMGLVFYGDLHEIPLRTGGTQTLTVNAGKAHANRPYWIFGSLGTTPGINLFGTHIPLNPDLYTDFAMSLVNTQVYARFKGTLDANGQATAMFQLPNGLPSGLPSITLYHACIVHDTSGQIRLASHAVPVGLR